MTHFKKWPCLEAVTDELDAAGLSYRVEHGKHAKVRVETPLGQRTIVVGMTTGTFNRSIQNARAGVKRLLRELDALGYRG